MAIDTLRFYNPVPILGKKFARQLTELRDNSNSLAPLVRAAFADIAATSGEHDLAGWALGELDFRNRFRTFYNKTTQLLIIQANTGTEAAPVWTDCMQVRYSDCRVQIVGAGGFEITQGGFYGTAVGETNTGANLGDGKGVFAQKAGVELQFKSLSAGTDISLTTGFYTITITSTASAAAAGGGFYGINVGETDDTPVYKGIDTVKFNSDSFYVTQQDTSTSIVNFRGSTGGGETNTASNLGTGEGVFGTKSGVDLQFKSLVAGNDISLSSDSNEITLNANVPAFYGLNVGETDDTPVFTGINTLKFNSTDFYVTQQDLDTAIVNSRGDTTDIVAGSNITVTKSGDTFTISATAGAGGAAFYGITVAETLGGEFPFDITPDVFRGINKINFQISDFYITQNDPNTDEVQVNLRTKQSGVGPTGPQGPQGDPGPAGGFYGINVKETDSDPSYTGINTLNFNSDDFYLTQNVGNLDEATINLRDSALGIAAKIVFVQDIRLAEDQARIEFYKIPQTADFLIMRGSCRSAEAVTQDVIQMQWNSDTGGNYTSLGASFRHASTTVNQTGSDGLAQTQGYLSSPPGSTAPAGLYNSFTIEIPDYSRIGKAKSYHGQDSSIGSTSTDSAVRSTFIAGANTSITNGINRIDIFTNGGDNIVADSRVTLFGLKLDFAGRFDIE